MTYSSPEDYIRAIKDDFARGGLHVARDLAAEAVNLYPDNEQIKYYAHVLAPPTVTVVPRDEEMSKNIQACQEWIRQNRVNYKNRWVAIRNGELLFDAASIDELADQLGDPKGIYITAIY